MADPLSIATSTVGIAAAGANISLTLYQFADKAGSAARDAKKIGHEISNLCAILHLLGTTLEEADEASIAPCASVAEEMNERCLKMFIEITELVQELERYIGHSGDNSFKWTERVKWALSKPRILYLRAGIESYKTTLHLMLMSLDRARRINKRRTSTISAVGQGNDAQQEALIQSLELAHSASVVDLADLEKQVASQELTLLEDYFPLSPMDENEPPPSSHATSSSKERSPIVESVREQLENLRESRARTLIFRVSKGIHGPRLSAAPARNSLWLSSEQLNLRNWRSSVLLGNLDAPLDGLPSSTSSDSRHSRQTTQIFDGISQAPSQPNGEARQDNCASPSLEDLKDTTHVEMTVGYFYEAAEAFQEWMGNLPDLERAEAARIFLDKMASPTRSLHPLVQPLGTRGDSENSSSHGEYPTSSDPAVLLPALTISPSSSPLPPPSPLTDPVWDEPDSDLPHPEESERFEVYKSCHVSIDDPAYKVLLSGLKEYGIAEDWRQYSLWAVSDDHEHCLDLNERPLSLFKQSSDQGYNRPKLVIRKVRANSGENLSATLGI